MYLRIKLTLRNQLNQLNLQLTCLPTVHLSSLCELFLRSYLNTGNQLSLKNLLEEHEKVAKLPETQAY